MNIPSAENATQWKEWLTERLKTRKDYRDEIKALIAPYRFMVFYGFGRNIESVTKTWNTTMDRKIDFYCDSDSAKWGKNLHGVPCISPEELMKIKDQCAVFVAIGNYRPVFDSLVKAGLPCVNVIYQPNLDDAEELASPAPEELASRFFSVREILADERSVSVFNAILTRFLENGRNHATMERVHEADQYFPPGVIKLSDCEAFADIGAFDGDTIRDFLRRTQGKFERIYAFELNRINFSRLQENVREFPGASRIRLFNVGAWDSECEITYNEGGTGSTVGSGETKGRVLPLDKALKGEKVTLLKMDIEGAEPNALRGAQNLILTQKPKLAVCIYHNTRHLWEIPLYLKRLVPDYKIYLRHHTTLWNETVCYAVV